MYSKVIALLTGLSLLLSVFALHGQSTPIGMQGKQIDQLDLPPLDNEQLIAAEMARRAPGIAPRFAHSFDVDVSTATHGVWRTKGDRAIWTLRVPSPGAKSLNFGFDRFYLPDGGKLMIYSPDRRVVQGPLHPPTMKNTNNCGHPLSW
ncbi:MAG: hypothetical protein R2795_23215 [Saprospiraceae bacterium]